MGENLYTQRRFAFYTCFCVNIKNSWYFNPSTGGWHSPQKAWTSALLNFIQNFCMFNIPEASESLLSVLYLQLLGQHNFPDSLVVESSHNSRVTHSLTGNPNQ